MKKNSNMNNSTSRRFAVVTGASSGIGFQLAKQFAQNGFDVMIAAENEEIHRAASELGGQGAKIEAVRVDLAQSQGVEELWSRIQAFGRPVDALALNAGVGVNGRFTSEIPLEDDLNLIALNVVSPIHLAKRVLPQMVKRGEGRVLITSSIASTMPGPFYATYAASKSFLQSFAVAIREELKDSGVTVTALMPGPTDTNFFERAGMEDTPAGQMNNKDDPALVAQHGFAALMAGKEHVVAGSFINKVQAAAAKVLPEAISAKIQGAQIKPESDQGEAA